MSHPTLFDLPPTAPFSGSSPTTIQASKEAAEYARGLAETDRALIYRAIKESGRVGLTDRELQDRLQMPGNTERPRRIELEKAGVIEAMGHRKINGRRHTVWTAVQA